MNGYDEYTDSSNQVTLENLDKFLGNKKDAFTSLEKESFVKSFKLDLSSDFAKQFELVISKLKEEDFIGNTDTEAIFYYANIASYLRRLVITNPPNQQKNRTCTKTEIFKYLKNGKNLIYSSTLRKNQGEQKYFKFIKNKHFSPLNIDDFERFIIIELSGDENISEIKDVVLKIINKFYNKSGISSKKVIKSGAPYIHFRNILEKNLTRLKTELLNEGIVFKDGHDFLNANFSINTIKSASTVHDNLCLKFINKKENLLELMTSSLRVPKEIYQFYINKSIVIEIDVKNIEIQIEDISDINFIL